MDRHTLPNSGTDTPILLVDDEQQILQAHRSALRLAGFEKIVTCSDAREVEGLVARSYYAVILLDLAMPHISGIGLLPTIRRYQPDTPVIVISAYGDVDAIAGAVKSHVYDFLLKPVDRKRLVSAVTRALAFGKRAGSDCVVTRLLLSEELGQEHNEHWAVSSGEMATLLQRTRQEYRLLFYGLPVAVFVFDRGTESVVFANRALRELLDFTGEIGDLDLLGLVREESERRAFSECLGGCDDLKVRTADMLLHCREDRQVWVNMRCTRAGEDGELVHGTLLDITERKQKEELAIRATNERESLLREIHHRVNNNLQVLTSMISVQLGHAGDNPSTGLLAAMQTRITTMAAVHRLMYELPHLSEIGLTGLAQAVADNVQEQLEIPGRHISLTLACEPRSVLLREVMPTALLLNELLSNSLKHAFGPDQTGNVSIDGKISKSGGYRLSVCDNGNGKPPFPDSPGLGLLLVTSFEQQLRGKGEFSRNTPSGTRYILELPPRGSGACSNRGPTAVREESGPRPASSGTRF